MGWGGARDDVGDQTEWTFTTANFCQYYVEFNQVYSLLLLLRLLRGPAAKLLPDIARKVVAALENRLNELIRWPEAVTFEELNLGLSRMGSSLVISYLGLTSHWSG